MSQLYSGSLRQSSTAALRMGKKRRRAERGGGSKSQDLTNKSPTQKAKKPPTPAKLKEMVFDPKVLSKISSDSEGSEFFFDLANADVVRFRSSGGEVVIQQDRDIEGEGQEEGVPQTGGIVWETAYLIFMYLTRLYTKSTNVPGSVLEVGAGCGLLGLALAQEWGCHVTLTDTPTATKTLVVNVSRNAESVKLPAFAEAKVLRWDVVEDRQGLADLIAKQPDIIVGTDVVFREDLVVPLLQTMHAFAKAETVVYLCLQTRCAAAHAVLLNEAPRFFQLQDISHELHALPGCGKVAKEMECHLLRLDTPTGVPEDER